MDLTRYFPAFLLEYVWYLEDQLKVEKGPPGGHPIHVIPTGSRAYNAMQIINKRADNPAQLCLLYKSLGLYMKQGPIIMRPSVNLCRALIDTEMRVPVSAFTTPFPIMGAEFPPEIIGPHYPSLTVLWKTEHLLMIWTLSKYDEIAYHIIFSATLPTIEDQFHTDEKFPDPVEHPIAVHAPRIMLNLCMLASTRQTQIDPLSPKVVRHRRARDERLNMLAAREIQEIRFRDLIIRESLATPHDQPVSGQPQARQHRRGHWKNVPYGPKHSKRRYQWINDYWTHPEDEDKQPPAIFLS